MTEDLYQKVILIIFSTSLGWLIAQLTNILKVSNERKKIIKLLNEELLDIKKEVERILSYYARNLHQNQRISFQMIHNLVHAQNENLKKLTIELEVAQDIYKTSGANKAIKVKGKTIGELSKSGYFNCLVLNWHLEFHLKNQEKPDLSLYSEAHKEHLKFLDTISEKIEKLVESGKNIKAEEFEKNYHEYYFN